MALGAAVLLLTACLAKLSSDIRQLASDLKVGMSVDDVMRRAQVLSQEYGKDLRYSDSGSDTLSSIEQLCRGKAANVVCVPANLPDHLTKNASGYVTQGVVEVAVLGRLPYGFSEALTVFYNKADGRIIGWAHSK